MAVKYGEVSQHDNDDEDRNDGAPHSTSLSPASSPSRVPFLPAVESTFTPLSMDDDFYVGVGESVGGDRYHDATNSDSHGGEGHKKFGSTATTKTGTSISSSSMAQSLSPARTTQANRSEYGLLSPDTTPSSPSSCQHPDDARSNPDFGSTIEKDLTSKHTETTHLCLKESSASPARAPQANEISSQHQQDSQQPVIIKPKPIVRTASTKSVYLRHPTPDLNTRSSSYATSIAQLEATAEKLSMTSSIEDAIRDLHEEQKRNESRRSSILAASIGSIPENNEPVSFPSTKPLSATSSVLDANSPARYGGYSPAGLVTSTDSSLLTNPTRLRSGSGPLSRPDSEVGGVMSRHGPGKSSVRSVKSASKPTLTDIAEMEPTTLTPAAMDEADRLAEGPEKDEILRIPQIEDIDLTPNANQYRSSNGYDYWDQAVAEARVDYGKHNDDDRPPTSAGSTGTYEQAERAFADFDGAHCPPDVDTEDSLFLPSFSNGPSTNVPFLRPFDPDPSRGEKPDYSRPISKPIGPPTVRPKSYMDPATGQTMLYYPARVPLMLNLPQKLSKTPKGEARNARKSQVLNKAPEPDRKSSSAWLPEFVPEPRFEPLGSNSEPLTHIPLNDTNPESQIPSAPEDKRNAPSQPTPDPGPAGTEANKARVSVLDLDKRRSKMPNLDGLPPQLRASAFFELPPEPPIIQLKDGSPMATLDSILDASAKAPVSAFTDHAFAGSLGSEVYGIEKKRKSHIKHASAADLGEPKKRGSFLHLRKPSALSRHSDSQEERGNTIAGGSGMGEAPNTTDEQDAEKQRLSSSIDGQAVPEHNDEDEESGGELVYNGPPTTLLAELQIRKQQQKLRTRPVTAAFPNGLHSTLLEMDTVAQIEHNARKGKKVNLAWEEPSMDPAEDSDDEDTPLGLLMATKGQGGNMATAVAEVNRPLGLMERREMEDNEPLSRRRDRLQGREVGLMKRQSVMTLGQGFHNASGSLRAPSPQLRAHAPEEEEIEGETLGERMRRLKNREQDDNPLPQARPISASFSAELLSQIGEKFKEDESDGKSQDKHKSLPKEEEETLGQRRRRLQAEREARERGMMNIAPNGGVNSDTTQVMKRHSLADVLGTHKSKNLLGDPRVQAEKARQAEAARYRQDQEQKMAALRSQMPSNLSTPNLNRPGGYMAGRFNDGTGGGTGRPRTSAALDGYPSQGFGASGGMANHANSGLAGNPYLMGGTMGGPGGLGTQMNAYGMQIQPPGQMDRVERWRQSILP